MKPALLTAGFWVAGAVNKGLRWSAEIGSLWLLRCGSSYQGANECRKDSEEGRNRSLLVLNG